VAHGFELGDEATLVAFLAVAVILQEFLYSFVRSKGALAPLVPDRMVTAAARGRSRIGVSVPAVCWRRRCLHMGRRGSLRMARQGSLITGG
jgi:hypothetical protein